MSSVLPCKLSDKSCYRQGIFYVARDSECFILLLKTSEYFVLLQTWSVLCCYTCGVLLQAWSVLCCYRHGVFLCSYRHKVSKVFCVATAIECFV